MSGLVNFFRSFLPTFAFQEDDDKEEGGDEKSEESTTPSQSDPAAETGVAYRESISTVRTSLSLPVNVPETTQVDEFSEEEEDATCTYQEWRLSRNEQLTNFAMKRLIDDAPTADEEDTDTSPDDDQN